jgi:hypothetical protein
VEGKEALKDVYTDTQQSVSINGDINKIKLRRENETNEVCL